MKLLDGLVLSEIAGEYVVVPTGDAVGVFKGIIRINDTARMIFLDLQEGKSKSVIAQHILDEYEGVDQARAEASVESVVAQLREAGLLED